MTQSKYIPLVNLILIIILISHPLCAQTTKEDSSATRKNDTIQHLFLETHLGLSILYPKNADLNITHVNTPVDDSLRTIEFKPSKGFALSVFFKYKFNSPFFLRGGVGISYSNYIRIYTHLDNTSRMSMGAVGFMEFPLHFEYCKMLGIKRSVNPFCGVSQFIGRNGFDEKADIVTYNLTLDAGINYYRWRKKKKVGIEFRYNYMPSKIELQRKYKGVPFTDKIQLGNLKIGLLLQY